VLEPFFFFGSSNHEVGNTSGPEIYDMARLLSASAAPDARQQTLPSLIHLLSVRGGGLSYPFSQIRSGSSSAQGVASHGDAENALENAKSRASTPLERMTGDEETPIYRKAGDDGVQKPDAFHTQELGRCQCVLSARSSLYFCCVGSIKV